MKLRLLFCAVGMLLCALGATAQANAATTLGYLAPGSPEAGEGAIVAFSPDPAYTVPFPGVITSWTVNGGKRIDGTSPLVALKLLQTKVDPGTGAITATVVGTTKTFAGGEGTQTHFTQLTVSKGDQLGIRFPEPGPLFAAGGESTACAAKDQGEIGAVYIEGQALTCASGQAVDVSATLEPDGDGDGFGDETQDRCPEVAGSATGCHSVYRGRVYGHPIKFRFGTRQAEGVEREQPVTVLEGNEYVIKAICPDGYKTGYVLYGGITKKRTVHIRPKGDFSYVLRIERGEGVTGGRTTVSGHLEGARVHGTVTGTIRFRHHGTCKVPSYSWRARS
jgi:hypothetical protein